MTTKSPPIIEKSEARLAAIKALYANAMNEQKKTAGNVVLDILTYYHNSEEEIGNIQLDEKFLKSLIEGITEKTEELNTLIEKHLDKSWKIERLDHVMLAILQAGSFELITLDKIPYKVIINEYVDIAKQFFDEKEVGFINAVLDRIAADTRSHE